MRPIVFFITLVFMSCSDSQKETSTSLPTEDSAVKEDPLSIDTVPEKRGKDVVAAKPSSEQVYSNKRFKEVRVEQTGPHEFRVTGKGQIFEAAFSWVVEDGHEELKNGFAMTDAGAPEWGKFSFVVDVQKKRPGSKIHLILYETSAKDGSRQFELPILLY